MQSETEKRISSLEAQVEQLVDEKQQLRQQLSELDDGFTNLPVLRSLAERAYALDPGATEHDLIKLGLRSWVAELRIDMEARRTRSAYLKACPAVGGPLPNRAELAVPGDQP